MHKHRINIYDQDEVEKGERRKMVETEKATV